MAMTEIDFLRDICPDVRRFTLDGADAETAVQVNIPHWAKKVTVRPEGKKIRMSFTTAADTIHDDYIKLSADSFHEFETWDGYNTPNGIQAIYLANKAGTVSTVVSVMIEGTSK
jgi:hypothetical protein